MNAQNYTQKSLAAIQDAQALTIRNENQQIEQIHLFSALLRQDDGLVRELLKRMGITVELYSDASKFESGTQDQDYYCEVWLPVEKK